MNIIQQAKSVYNTNNNLVQTVVDQVQIQMSEDKIELNQIQHKPDFAFYLFVNPKSGGNRAGQLLRLEAEKVTFFLEDNSTSNINSGQFQGKIECDVLFYNMAEELARKLGMQKLKKDQMSGVNVRVLVGGGDGTIMWVVNELVLNDINLANCPIGIIPFGTGNDFARVTGWGGDSPSDVLGHNLSNLKKLVKLWTQSVIEDFDIWEIKITTYEHGYFKKVDKDVNGFQKRVMKYTDKANQQQNIKVFKQKMCNYFSFGVDARIGIIQTRSIGWGFDKSRTRSAFGNKCVYCCEGFKKIFLKTPSVNNTLLSMEVLVDNIMGQSINDPGKLEINVEENNTKEILFLTNQDGPNQPILNNPSKNNSRLYQLKGNPINLLCLNIPSYSGGASDVWAESKGVMGLRDPVNVNYKVLDGFQSQDFGDSILEFVCFSSIMGLASERFFKGQASRCAQGNGPFLFKFKQDDPLVTPIRQYLQIDGEYFMVYHPQFVKIRQTKSIPNGKIKVMVDRTFRDKRLSHKKNSP